MARKRGVLHACSSFPCDSLPYKLLIRFYEVEQRLAKKKNPASKGPVLADKLHSVLSVAIKLHF